MPADIKEKDKLEQKEVKKTRKSFVLPEVPVNIEKIKKTPKPNKSVKSSIGFPNEEYRLLVTEAYKKCGFSTMKAYIMALIDLSINDEDTYIKLQEKAYSR